MTQYIKKTISLYVLEIEGEKFVYNTKAQAKVVTDVLDRLETPYDLYNTKKKIEIEA